MSSRRQRPTKPDADKRVERERAGTDKLRVVTQIAYTTPGKALDARLRREQAGALLALLGSSDAQDHKDADSA